MLKRQRRSIFFFPRITRINANERLPRTARSAGGTSQRDVHTKIFASIRVTRGLNFGLGTS
ncbi:MAG: hypothetical protein DME90_06830 [Verrucomicrobia bacterium]|nr:MAG: hypothetical protein DME90_06830 [Verrucomicrobiota bacterium]